MKVCLGGTFSIIHAGHEALLRRACQEGDQVMVGLTSDEMARRRGKQVPPYEERKKQLQECIQQICNTEAEIVPLNDEYGPAATGACDGIVVSPETAGIAEQINDIRCSHDIAPLQVITVPYVLADDGIPVSSSRISNKEIDGGHRITPLHVVVGTSSETKQAATEAAFQRLLGHLDIQCTMEPVKTPENPAGEQVWDGARHRAEQSIGTADYGVGIEAGIVTRQKIAMLEHVCTLVDSAGYTTHGTGPAFQIPSSISGIGQGNDIADMRPKDTESLAAYLSGGTVTRKQLVQGAVAMALLPRLHGRRRH
ncbi:MAG: pantetheine-phosphate adenylyltransferase [Thermoplasmatota archaeon]